MSSTSVFVEIETFSGSPAIDFYRARIKEGKDEGAWCSVVSTRYPLQCQINGLTPDTTYTVEVRSCISGYEGDDGCISDSVEGRVWTPGPRRELTVSTVL